MTRYQGLVARIEDPGSTSQVTTRPWETDPKLYPTTHQPIWQVCLRNAQGSSYDYPFAGDETKVRQALRNLFLERGRLEPELRTAPSEDILSKAMRLEAADDAVSSRIQALGDERLEPLLRYSTEPETAHYPAAARKLREYFAATARQVGRDDLLPLRVSPHHVISGAIIVEAYGNVTGMSPDAVRHHLEQHLGELETINPQVQRDHGSPSSVDRIVSHATFQLEVNAAVNHKLELDRSGAAQTVDPMRVALSDLPTPAAKSPANTRSGGGGEQDRPSTLGQRRDGLTRS